MEEGGRANAGKGKKARRHGNVRGEKQFICKGIRWDIAKCKVKMRFCDEKVKKVLGLGIELVIKPIYAGGELHRQQKSTLPRRLSPPPHPNNSHQNVIVLL
ncbi:hypothetical protein GPALN_011041 [Globodera pallida]|nr:hypothetical protein GPALN_011041 [Globodera pallida]